MEHEFRSDHITCPNCKQEAFETSYESVYACVNPTCEWLMGPDRNVDAYLKPIKN